MADGWVRFGFRSTPYSFEPLGADDEGVSLHIGREEQSSQFLSLIDQAGGGIIIISGDIGLGKTSFLNVQQQLIYTGKAGIEPRLLISRRLTSIEKGDTIVSLAQRVVHNFVSGLEAECESQKKSLPKLAAKIKQWMSHEGHAGGFSFGLEGFDFGVNFDRHVSAPAVSEAKLENWKEILELLVVEAKTYLGMDGALICIDNTETLSVPELAEILMFYRDTLFSIRNILWVIVGQSDLFAEIDRVDPRVSQRIRGTGIEIEPLTSEELHELVAVRIQHLRSKPEAESPLSKKVHNLLYEASCGQPRYVLKAADTLFIGITTEVRMRVLARQRKNRGAGHNAGAPEFMQEMMDRVIADLLVDHEVPDAVAENLLRKEIVKGLKGKKIPADRIVVLKRLGNCASEGAEMSALCGEEDAQKFEVEVLKPLEEAGLVFRFQEEATAKYRLKGDAWLCNHFDCWDEVAKNARARRSIGS